MNTTYLSTPESRLKLAAFYQDALLNNVIPFWIGHGLDREYGGMLTALDRDGSLLDTDKSVWFQGRAGWMFATLYNTIERRAEWLEAARSCIEFSRRYCFAPDGKMYFSVTREGRPLRMRRYVYSESFAAVANAAFAKATGDARAADDAVKTFATYLRYSFEPGVMNPKFEPTRPAKGLAALMICVVTAQELRANLGDVRVSGRTCTEWIDVSIAEIERDFLKPDLQALMEMVAPDGRVIDHLDGRTLNPGHAIECAWFVMHEGERRGDKKLIQLGARMLDWMWARGWDMKFWWPHNEAIIATLLAWQLTGEEKYARWHKLVHDWSFQHFSDPEFGEWYGYLHRDGSVSQRAKGNLYKGPFHLPRMLWYGSRIAKV